MLAAVRSWAGASRTSARGSGNEAASDEDSEPPHTPPGRPRPRGQHACHLADGGAPMAHLRREVHSYLTPSDYRRLEQEAAARGASVSKCVADCLGEYFALRVEMASVVAAPGQLGEPHQGLIHSLLARTEERLAATLKAHGERTAALEDAVEAVRAMIDRLVLLYFVHTPEVPAELKGAPLATAPPRYTNWRPAGGGMVHPGGLSSLAPGAGTRAGTE